MGGDSVDVGFLSCLFCLGAWVWMVLNLMFDIPHAFIITYAET